MVNECGNANTKTSGMHCRCGEVRGRVMEATPATVNRVICYCADCQAFLHYLGRPDLLDAHGGTDIVQIAPASMSFVQGQERIVGLRLTPKGLYRFYTSCCKTPLGNTVGPAIPFIGIVAQAFDGDGHKADDVFGRPIGAIYGKYAVGDAPKGSMGINPGLLLRALRMVLGWRIRGKAWPHPFFDRATRAPSFSITVLSPSEREALRPLCGPRPAASA